jgi:hypothetical protein
LSRPIIKEAAKGPQRHGASWHASIPAHHLSPGSGDERGPHLNYAPRSHKGASVKLRRRISRPREALLDHLIGQREELRWDVNAKGFGGLQVDGKLEGGWVFNR